MVMIMVKIKIYISASARVGCMNGGTSLDTEAHSEEHHLRQFLLHLGEMRSMKHHDTKKI